ncbi:MAG: glycoside hydrolase family 31 protein [Terrimicrobiaceae bacterium]|nr:glycoside hydrolase family 31 protein [Terrimicrobiaceae bacterium]
MKSSVFSEVDGALVWTAGSERLEIRAWGNDSLRVRAVRAGSTGTAVPQALISAPTVGSIWWDADRAEITSGAIAGRISSSGVVEFVETTTGRRLLSEAPSAARLFRAACSMDRVENVFEAVPGERFYGLGQHQHGRLDQKGCVIELSQRNTEVAIPFLLSSLGYGFLWNSPAIGRVELAHNGTRWVAEAAPAIDYWITTAKEPSCILRNYVDATGHAPMLPEWAAGFWQSKLRYASQEELLGVAREYRRRGLPLSVIVIDYFHWPAMGDWCFDPVSWPDPAGMVRELESMGIRVMVSVWPTVNAASRHYEDMMAQGLLVQTERGVGALTVFVDTPSDDPVFVHHYDATNPAARDYLWQKIRAGYFDKGIKVFWLDACEPEMKPADHSNVRYSAGNGLAVGCIYPLAHQQAFFDGLRSEGETEIVTLCRSAWAGSQRYGAALWSGDIPSTFEALRAQVRGGLNAGLSGIPWWTTDIGGFHSGDIESEGFRELIVRWFQYGVFCPLFRLHGVREPATAKSGGPNEVWCFGEPAGEIIAGLLRLRERMKPYVLEQMQTASEEGRPPMRPLFFDFPNDPNAWDIEDQFLFGPDLLIAPVLESGAVQRRVYLPAGSTWVHRGRVFAGGEWHEVPAPLDVVPVFSRSGANTAFLDQ